MTPLLPILSAITLPASVDMAFTGWRCKLVWFFMYLFASPKVVVVRIISRKVILLFPSFYLTCLTSSGALVAIPAMLFPRAVESTGRGQGGVSFAKAATE
uniref:Uncharacterized protein n=1 Tax=Ixodes ricinus TaxID=34613 RepID=A0A6B0UEN0_IXORI